MDALAFRPADAAKLIGVSRSRLYELVRDGELRGFSVGSIRLFSAEELRGWIADREARAKGEAAR